MRLPPCQINRPGWPTFALTPTMWASSTVPGQASPERGVEDLESGVGMRSGTRRLNKTGIWFCVLALTLTGACRGTVGSAPPAAEPSNDSGGTSNAGAGRDGNAASARTSGPNPRDRVLPSGDPGVVDVTFDVQTDRDARSISPMIYGINFDIRDVANQRWGVIRSGGNRLTAYNWENNASNAGSDYLFQNDGSMSGSDEPAKPLLDIIDAASSIDAPTVITIPNVDYVSADKNGGGDVRNSGPNYLATRFKRNYPKKPSALAPAPDVHDNAVYQDEFVAYLKAKRPKSHLLFSMDNEPELWSHTHAEVYPKPVTYADLWQRNRDYAKAVKASWPGAEVLGFVSYGYNGFKSLQDAADAGGRNFVEWYLDQASAAEKAEGKRLIDFLDVHWYPEAQGGGQRVTSSEVGPEVVAARVQAPRSLWDASYQEKSWIRDAAGGPIDLIHWLQTKIDAHYPGTKLAFTEWNYGAGNHISGAIAVADVLGIFGQYGVSLATYWPLQHDESFAHAAFRVFRNYDGGGAAFRDTSVAASTSDRATATVHASIDSREPARVVIVAINKATTPKTAGVKIAHSVVYATAKVFQLTGARAVITSAAPLSAVATNAFKLEMPAQSISVIVPQE
jgi:hypothetical protein